MTDINYPIEQRLALAHAGTAVRPLLRTFIALDQRLAQFVSQTKESMLTQMRIAWWRDQFGKAAADRPTGDPVLDSLTQYWLGEEASLTALVDGWEGLLAEPPLPESAAMEFAEGRGQCFAAIARLSGHSAAGDAAQSAGETWALADLAARMSSAEEREFVVEAAHKRISNLVSLPRQLRALTILGKLGRRALDDGGRPLITGRTDLLLISRVGLFGW
ncbi:hypothetical protein QWY75_04005 [Pontixanthobacter aestiaquae]|uniref:Phytoene synthase n=1 Tax=Pontixanthobacter aestiaquae TaxID=1509367 RepID=A0A844Z745_9SPHN|nr:hypothetical protein [Pontixanthobacter aestiaquae]MDN3645371.1 hypothetical protein [Pontixanthobacter aestiaquae]MXO83628.1 hypothetical protein [Pontixanthobacter aestiaquae]